MQVRIYKPTKTAMQSGVANTKKWLLEFIYNKEAKKNDSLMGWFSSNDTLEEVKLKFEAKEAAIEFANANNYAFELIEPAKKKIIKRSYADNFK